MGISGTFDERSPRIVRPSGALATIQEYNERVYNGVLDAASNGRGEVRFIAQDAAAAGTYYVYFDIVANGAKAANAATPINGTFEQSVGSTPTSWVVSALNAGGAQNDEVYRTALGATTTVAAGCQTTAQSVDSSPARSGAVCDRRGVDVARLSRPLRRRYRRGTHSCVARHCGAGGSGGGQPDVQFSGAGLGRHLHRHQLRLGDRVGERNGGESHRARHQQHDHAAVGDRSGPFRTQRLQHDVSRSRLEAGDTESLGVRRQHDQLPRRNAPHLFGRRLSFVGKAR